MMKYQLGVAVSDTEYLRRLADYIRDSKYSEHWQITAFTHAEACKRYMGQGYKLDMLIAQPVLLAEIKPVLPRLTVIALVLTFGESTEEHELQQYQPLPRLLQRMSEIHARSTVLSAQAPTIEDRAGGTQVLAVYSASGGTGKTGLALHIAHAASMHRFRAFYLNLERWNSSESWLGPNRGEEFQKQEARKEEGLSELLYCIKTQSGQAGKWLLEHRKRDALLGADYLALCTNLEDRLTLSEEDTAWLLEAISASGQYDLIIVDMDSDLDGTHMSVFEKSNLVLWVSNGSASARQKQNMVLRYGEQKWDERFTRMLGKFTYVNNQAVSNQTVGFREMAERDPVSFHLPEIADWRGASDVKLLSSPLYRAAADQLFKQLFLEGEGMIAE
ncbi:hypothetical protein AB4Z29_02155 [Paenibacillus sp. 2TAB23]|uniref:hypothetical protein n=1 Tax=Paenibacillus sp. 2TAB23 TaxID=3233004 RepID=UPI003F98C95A